MKATSVAKKNVVEIPIFNTTIPHEVNAKVGGARVLLMPASPGTGIIAGGTVRAIINVTGINNLLSKSLGSTNKVNAAYATIEALMHLRSKDQWVTTELENTKAAATKAKESASAKDDTSKVVAKKPAKKVAKKTEGTK